MLHITDGFGHWLKSQGNMNPHIDIPEYYYKSQRFLDNQFISAVMSGLQMDVVDGLSDGMSRESLVKFREDIKSLKGV